MFFLTASAAVYVSLQLLTPLSLAPDEAHYWDWSRQLDFSYYSKGPGIAVVIRAFTSALGDTAFAVRLPALLFMLAFSLALFLLLRKWVSPGLSLLLVAAAGISLLFGSMHLVMTTDPPSAFFWLLSLAGFVWFLDTGRNRFVIAGALLAGIAFLFKYTAILLPVSFAALCLISPRARAKLSLSGTAGAVLLFALAVSPVLLWNMQHGWVNLQHNAAHLGASKGLHFKPKYLAELIGGQIGLAGPALLAILVLSVRAALCGWKEREPAQQFLLLTILLLAAFCLGVSLIKPVYANWPMPLYIAALLLFARAVRDDATLLERARPWIKTGLAVNSVLLVTAFALFLGKTFWVPPERLPTKKLAGWQTLGEQAQTSLDDARRAGADVSHVLVENYDAGSAIAFYAPSHPRILNGVFGSRRMNQYDIWGGWEEARGRDLLIVLKDEASLDLLRPRFARIDIEHLRRVPIHYGGKEFRTFLVVLGRKFDGIAPAVPLLR